MGHQAGERTQVQALQALAFDDAPILVAVDQQVSAIEADRLGIECGALDRCFGLLGQLAATFEFRDVQPGIAGGVEPDLLWGDAQVATLTGTSAGRLEHAIDSPQGGIQRVARALFFGVAPEDTREVFAGVQTAAVESQVREQLARFAAGEALHRAAVALELEGTEKPDVQRHGRLLLGVVVRGIRVWPPSGSRLGLLDWPLPGSPRAFRWLAGLLRPAQLPRLVPLVRALLALASARPAV